MRIAECSKCGMWITECKNEKPVALVLHRPFRSPKATLTRARAENFVVRSTPVRRLLIPARTGRKAASTRALSEPVVVRADAGPLPGLPFY